MSWMDSEPVRGSYPGPELIALPGAQRMGLTPEQGFPPPPIAHLFGLRPVESSDGASTFSMPASPWLQTGPGLFLGGVAALVADAPLGSAILSRVPAGAFGVTSELTLSYLRPASVESEMLYAHAQVIDIGRSVGLSQAIVEDACGRMLAHTTSRYFISQLDPVPERVALPPYEIPDYPTPDPYLRPLPPTQEGADWTGMSGIDIFRAVMLGKIPPAPIDHLFGLRWTDVDEGSIELRVTATPWLTSPARTIYGGVIAFLADAAITAAVATTVPAGSSCATLDLRVHYLRPGIPDGRDLVTRATLEHRGRSFVVARAEILNADGKRIAVASGSAMILQGKPWTAVSVADEAAPDDQDP